MKHSALLIACLALTLASCSTAAPAASTVIPTPAPAAATALPTATFTFAQLSQPATLYSGPGNADFDSLANFPAGTTVHPLGIYGDFVKATAVTAGIETTGFIWKNAILDLPGQLPVLDSDQVPWQPFYLPTCALGAYNADTDSMTFANTGDSASDTEEEALTVEAPIRINIAKLTVTGSSYGAIKVLGIPETQQPWWKGITRMDIADSRGYYVLELWDGSSAEATASIDLARSTSQALQIVFDQAEGKSLTVLDENNHVLRSVDLTKVPGLHLPNGLFPDRKAYFGTSTAPQSTLIVSGMTVGSLPTGAWEEQSNADPGLVSLAKGKNLTLGTEFALNAMADQRYCRLMQRNFDVAVLSDFSAKGLWLGPGQYDFKALDQEVDYANQHGWRVRASHLVWGYAEAIPDWLLNGTYTRAEYIGFLEEHIKTLVGRYKGRVQEWSVANEAIERSFAPGKDFWNDKIGPEYVAMAFRWAREADPTGVLILNGDDNESPRDEDTRLRIDTTYSTVKALKAQGVPIDVIGLEMHLFLPWNSQIAPQTDDVIQTMRQFAALGVRIYVTEFDVDLTNVTGTPAQKLAYQAELYGSMMKACLESGVCDSFATWGISDATSWITCALPWCVNEPNAEPLMFDRDYNPKPAYFALRAALSGASPTAAATPQS